MIDGRTMKERIHQVFTDILGSSTTGEYYERVLHVPALEVRSCLAESPMLQGYLDHHPIMERFPEATLMDRVYLNGSFWQDSDKVWCVDLGVSFTWMDGSELYTDSIYCTIGNISAFFLLHGMDYADMRSLTTQEAMAFIEIIADIGKKEME